MHAAAALVKVWLGFLVAVLVHPPVAALADRSAFAVTFTSPHNFDRVSNAEPLTLSWSCTPLPPLPALSQTADANQPPKLVLSIVNEIIQTQVVSQQSASTGTISVSMMGTPPSNFTARAVVIRGGLFVSAFATVFFEVYDAELDRLTAGVVAALHREQPSPVFVGVSETSVTSCSCRDAASTDVAAIPLLPSAVRNQPRMCSLHVDGAFAADVMISPSALVASVNSSVPSLAVQVSVRRARCAACASCFIAQGLEDLDPGAHVLRVVCDGSLVGEAAVWLESASQFCSENYSQQRLHSFHLSLLRCVNKECLAAHRSCAAHAHADTNAHNWLPPRLYAHLPQSGQQRLHIITLHCNRPNFMLLQRTSFQHFLRDNGVEWTVVFDNRDSSIEDALRAQCEEISSVFGRTRCLQLPNEAKAAAVPGDASGTQSEIFSWIWREVVMKRLRGQLVSIVDGDMFAISPFSFRELMGGFSMAGSQQHREIKYLASQLFVFDTATMPNAETVDLRYEPTLGADTGGALHFYLSQNVGLRVRNVLQTSHINSANRNLHVLPEPARARYHEEFRLEIYEHSLLHYGSGSNWKHLATDDMSMYQGDVDPTPAKTEFVNWMVQSCMNGTLSMPPYWFAFSGSFWRHT